MLGHSISELIPADCLNFAYKPTSYAKPILGFLIPEEANLFEPTPRFLTLSVIVGREDGKQVPLTINKNGNYRHLPENTVYTLN